MAELKFVITGTAGVGKTTAITSISDVPPVTTDTVTTDELKEVKATTTTAFDFGEILLDDDTCIRIYGTPGQERFRHMWEILAEGALGLIVLIDHTRPNPTDDLNIYLNNFPKLALASALVVGITRVSAEDEGALEPYYQALEKREIYCPVMAVDPRLKTDMVDLMDSLISYLEYANAS